MMKKNVIYIFLILALTAFNAIHVKAQYIPTSGNTNIKVITKSAKDITDDSATLQGEGGGYISYQPGCVSTEGYSTVTGLPCTFGAPVLSFPLTAYFRYSQAKIAPIYCNDIYGTNMKATSDIKLNDIYTPQSFYKKITGLTPDTTYYYCAIISNRDKIAYGGTNIVKEFHTSPLHTTATTKTASKISSTQAYVTGSYSSGQDVKTYFKYKEVTLKKENISFFEKIKNFVANLVVKKVLAQQKVSPINDSGVNSSWKTTPVQEHLVGKHSSVYGDVGATLTGLKPKTNYVFVLVAEEIKTGNIKEGGISSFTTMSAPVSNSGSIRNNSTPTQQHSVNLEEGGGTSGGGSGIGSYHSWIEFESENENESGSGGGNSWGNGWSGGNSWNSNANSWNYGINGAPTKIGDTAIPPDLSLVRSQEGIETVFTRQIMASQALQNYYGYESSQNLYIFALDLADALARVFGYINEDGKEIRVSFPDVAAYELRLNGNILTVYEYYAGKVVNIQSTTQNFKNKSGYEYYFQK